MISRRIATPYDLGAAIRDARTAAGLTQADLAERSGVSREWLVGVEQGKRPRAELTKVLAITSALDLPLVIGGPEDTGAHPAPIDDDELSSTAMTRQAIARARDREDASSAARSSEGSAPALSESLRAALAAPLTDTWKHQMADVLATMKTPMPTVDAARLLPEPSAALRAQMSHPAQALASIPSSAAGSSQSSQSAHDLAAGARPDDRPEDAS